MEELESLVKNGDQSKVVPKRQSKLAHVFAKKSYMYQVQSEFNNSVLKKLKDALEADTSEESGY